MSSPRRWRDHGCANRFHVVIPDAEVVASWRLSIARRTRFLYDDQRMMFFGLERCQRRLLKCVLLLPFAPFVASGAEPLTITEFSAVNATGLRDEDGAYSDWIEL